MKHANAPIILPIKVITIHKNTRSNIAPTIIDTVQIIPNIACKLVHTSDLMCFIKQDLFNFIIYIPLMDIHLVL